MQPSTRISIGVVARQTNCSVPTIRYYEEIGLLPVATRSESGQRSYGAATVKRLAFVRRCRDLGFSIDAIRELVSLVDEPDRPCIAVRDIASIHLSQVRRKQQELRELENSLANFVASCDSACLGGAADSCTILDALVVPRHDAAVANGGCC